MVNVLSFISDLYERFNLPVASVRRDSLIHQMDDLKQDAIHCLNCNGACCTSVNNSMMVDPLQALELLAFLMTEKRVTGELIANLNDNVSHYRLNVEIMTGRNSTLRKTYTCPFFKEGARGCSISPEYKPYGCLAFNPLKSEVARGGDCSSNIELLKNRETKFFKNETEVNNFLKNVLDIYWDKKPMPVALLELIEKLPKMTGLLP